MFTKPIKLQPEIKIRFLGAAQTVTGSKYLLQCNNKKIMIDCGLFQGLKELRLLNWQPLPINATEIDMVLLTHAHLDHCGYLPRLVKSGFKGKIWGTKPTLEIAKIILEDSARIGEEDAKKANKGGYSKHHPAVPLYDTDDVEKTIPLFHYINPAEWITIDDKISCRFRYNGHILGATFIEFKIGKKILVFSGDIGRNEDPLLYPPQKPEEADILIIESTYGNRLHPQNTEEQLIDLITKGLQNNGTILIPSFAVERTQALMYLLWKLKQKDLIPNVPVYMDSPMGSNVLNVFRDNLDWHTLKADECNEMCKNIKFIDSEKETHKLAANPASKIVIAGSGMASGGRILNYFAQYLGDVNATVLLAGFQAEGTRGRALLDGKKEIKLFGKYFAVRANIANIDGLSAHAGQDELINWISKLKWAPTQIYIVHGEKPASESLQHKIKQVYNWNAAIPVLNQEITISGEFEML